MNYEISPGETISEAVVSAVSTFEDREPTSFDPLAERIDPDAMNRLFKQQPDTMRRIGMITFVYSHSRVTVQHNEYIKITHI